MTAAAPSWRHRLRRTATNQREPWWEKLNIATDRARGRTAALILNMGKVGSQTLKHSIAAASDDVHAYTLHYLSLEGIRSESARVGLDHRDPAFPQHLLHSLAWRTARDRDRLPPLRVLTIVREPIGRQLSHLCYNAPRIARHLLDADGRPDPDAVRAELTTWVADYADDRTEVGTYLDRELRDELGVDVYSTPFDHDTGAQVITGQAYPTLVLRTEDLDRALATEVPAFLGIPGPLPVLRTNQAADSPYADRYRQLRETLSFRRDHVAAVYDGRYARQFWDEQQRAALIEWWSRT